MQQRLIDLQRWARAELTAAAMVRRKQRCAYSRPGVVSITKDYCDYSSILQDGADSSLRLGVVIENFDSELNPGLGSYGEGNQPDHIVGQ
jgi:hypothetical protein